MSDAAAIILAAGQSTRMKSDAPKVLHPVCGRPMLSYVLSACRLAGLDRLIVVVGHGKDEVISAFEGEGDITWVEQSAQKGTGHAVQCCRDALRTFDGSVLVIAGDMPLVRRETLAHLLESRARTGAGLAMATTTLGDPTGYGRIVRDASGALEAIVEDRNCTDAQRKIREVNPSYYCFDAKALFEALERIQCDPGKGEYFLTDTVEALRALGREVSTVVEVPSEDAAGINSRLDLASVGRMMQDRIQLALMADGVTIVDPDNTWIEADVVVGANTTIFPFSFLGAGTTVGEGCRIGPFAHLEPGAAVEDGVEIAPLAANGAAVT